MQVVSCRTSFSGPSAPNNLPHRLWAQKSEWLYMIVVYYVLWGTMGYHRVPWGIIGYHGLSCSVVGYHRVSSALGHALLWKTKGEQLLRTPTGVPEPQQSSENPGKVFRTPAKFRQLPRVPKLTTIPHFLKGPKFWEPHRSSENPGKALRTHRRFWEPTERSEKLFPLPLPQKGLANYQAMWP